MTIRLHRSFAVVLAVLLAGCTSPTSSIAHRSKGLPSETEGASARAGIAVPADQGPFAGLRWEPRPIKSGSLLHDDGTHLWAYSPTGVRSIVWTHPRAVVYELAADVRAGSIAMVVGSARIEGSYLYVLEPGGSVEAIRRVTGGWDIWLPVFAKGPTDPHGPTRIYWTEHSPGLFDRSTDTPVMRAMSFDGSAVSAVRIPLLWGEAPWRMDAYPGNTTMTLTVFRRSNIPTFHEVLRNEDLISGGTSSSSLVLGYWQQIAETDSEAGVAWLSPNRYVVQVGKSPAGDGDVPRSSLVMYDVGCEFRGGGTIWSGSNLDAGTFSSYSLLAPDPNHVLAIRQARGSGSTRVSDGWLSIDVRTGAISAWPVHWGRGPWTAVRDAARPTTEGPRCAPELHGGPVEPSPTLASRPSPP